MECHKEGKLWKRYLHKSCDWFHGFCHPNVCKNEKSVDNNVQDPINYRSTKSIMFGNEHKDLLHTEQNGKVHINI